MTNTQNLMSRNKTRTMKKKFLIICSLLILIVLLVYIYNSDLFNNRERIRPDSIPESTYYLGGIDGGVWIDTLRVNKTTMKLIIYSDYGELLDTTFFIIDRTCNFEQEIKKVEGYNGRNLVIKK